MIYEGESYEEEEEIQIEDLEQAPPKMEANKPQVHDPMKKSTSALCKRSTLALWKTRRAKDYFSWNYDEMPGLDKSLVEHC